MMDNWQKIETAPRDGTVIIVYCPHDVPHWVAGVIPDEESLNITLVKSWPAGHPTLPEKWESVAISEPDSYDPGYIQSYQEVSPTHWMPLPEPPLTSNEP